MQLQNISISEELSIHVQAIIAGGKHKSVSDYVDALILRDKEQTEAAVWLQKINDEAIASGPPVEMTPQEIGEMISVRVEKHLTESKRQAG